MDKIKTHLLRIRKGKVKLCIRHRGKKLIDGDFVGPITISVGQESGTEAEIRGGFQDPAENLDLTDADADFLSECGTSGQ